MGSPGFGATVNGFKMGGIWDIWRITDGGMGSKFFIPGG